MRASTALDREPARRPDRAASGPCLTLGTAGHIDHGKTALVRALTGVDTDRLPEEKARGITLELGFAPLALDDGRVLSVVDVPGHERLVRTMVAGATGIDLVLLVVAADEGVMPQTREHVAVCDLLGLRHGVVALTKADLADPEMLELAREEVEALLAGTALAGAPVVPVSAAEGRGLPALREALARAAAAATPRTPRGGAPRLPVDRAFAVKGFGVVVTGTLSGGALAVGDAVELLPGERRARVRGLERFGTRADRIEAGGRCAVNLQGLEVGDVSRGDVLTAPDALVPTSVVDLALAWVPGAPALDAPAAVSFLVGTAERRARLAPIGTAPARVKPGSEGFARAHLEGLPLPLLPGDRCVVRGFARGAAGATLGGGLVLDVAPPRRRLSDPALVRDLERLARRDPREDLRVRIEREGLAGVREARLARETGLRDRALERPLEALARAGAAAPGAPGRWLSTAAWQRLEGLAEVAVADFHAAEPLRPGMPRGALRGRLPPNVPEDVSEAVVDRLAAAGRVIVRGDRVRLPGHAPALSEADRAIAERMLAEARDAGLDPPAPRAWSESLGIPPERLRGLLAFLEAEGRLVRAPGDLWFETACVDRLRARVRAHLEAHGALDTPAYKELIGTSRRAAVPLMELFDAERLTVRKGNRRVLRRAAGG